jgi:hypothetical protein
LEPISYLLFLLTLHFQLAFEYSNSYELITDKSRYKKLARWQTKIPDVEIEGLKLRALQVAASIQGFHLHLQ